MAEKIADAFVEIGARTSKFERGMAKTRKGTNQMAAGFKRLAQAAVAFFAVRKIVSFTKETINATSSMENLEVRLTTMLRSQKKAAEGMQFFSDIASKVPFSIDKIAEAGVTLQAMGADFKKWLPVLSDLAAFMGEDVVFAASAMGRAFAGGAGAADVFREKGILEIIKSSSGIRDFSNKTLPEFRKAMFNAFIDPTGKVAGAAKAMSETWTGQLSMLGDSIFKLKDELGKTLLPAMKELVTFTIKPLINEWAEWVKVNKDFIKEDIAFHIHNIKTAIDFLSEGIRFAMKNYAEFRATFILASLDMRKKWIDFVTSIKITWETITGSVAEGMLVIKNLWTNTVANLKMTWLGFISGTKVLYLELQKVFSNVMAKVIKGLTWFLSKIEKIPKIGKQFTGIRESVKELGQGFSDSSKNIQKDIDAVNGKLGEQAAAVEKTKKILSEGLDVQRKMTQDRIKQIEDAANKEKALLDSLGDDFLKNEMERIKTSLETTKEMGKNEEDFTKKVEDENKKRKVSFGGLTDILKKIQEGAFIKAGKSPLTEIAKVTTKPQDQFTGTVGVKAIKDQTNVAKDSNTVLKEMNNTLKTKSFVPQALMG